MPEDVLKGITDWLASLRNDSTDLYLFLLFIMLITATKKILKTAFFIIISVILIGLFVYVTFIRI